MLPLKAVVLEEEPTTIIQCRFQGSRIREGSLCRLAAIEKEIYRVAATV